MRRRSTAERPSFYSFFMWSYVIILRRKRFIFNKIYHLFFSNSIQNLVFRNVILTDCTHSGSLQKHFTGAISETMWGCPRTESGKVIRHPGWSSTSEDIANKLVYLVPFRKLRWDVGKFFFAGNTSESNIFCFRHSVFPEVGIPSEWSVCGRVTFWPKLPRTSS